MTVHYRSYTTHYVIQGWQECLILLDAATYPTKQRILREWQLRALFVPSWNQVFIDQVGHLLKLYPVIRTVEYWFQGAVATHEQE